MSVPRLAIALIAFAAAFGGAYWGVLMAVLTLYGLAGAFLGTWR